MAPARVILPDLDAEALDRGSRSRRMSAGGMTNTRMPSLLVVGVVLVTLAPSKCLHGQTSSSLSDMGHSSDGHDAAGAEVGDSPLLDV